MKWNYTWMVWPKWFGFGKIDTRADWYEAFAFGPLLVERFKEPREKAYDDTEV